VAFIEDRCEQAVETGGRVARTLMAPWGGAEACVDAYEAAIRATSDAQLSLARAIPLQPARAFIASCADLTRDVGATQLSRARWMLDL
jgi:hypothetical protein